MKFLTQLASNKFYVAAAIALAVLVILALVLIIWRIRRANRSKYGFRDERVATTSPAALRDSAAQAANELDEFDSKRGQRIVDVLLDYASVKGLQLGVYAVRLGLFPRCGGWVKSTPAATKASWPPCTRGAAPARASVPRWWCSRALPRRPR